MLTSDGKRRAVGRFRSNAAKLPSPTLARTGASSPNSCLTVTSSSTVPGVIGQMRLLRLAARPKLPYLSGAVSRAPRVGARVRTPARWLFAV